MQAERLWRESFIVDVVVGFDPGGKGRFGRSGGSVIM
jgi:hypothetical protein